MSQLRSLKHYIHKVGKQVHPDLGFSKRGIQIVDDLIHDLARRLVHVIVEIKSTPPSHNKKHRISSRDISSAVRLVIGGELAKHSVSELTKAVTRFVSRTDVVSRSTTGKRPRVPSASRAGLVFPPKRFHNFMKRSGVKQVSMVASVALAAVCEYLASELVELSGNAARDNKRQRHYPRSLVLAIRNDTELSELFKGSIASGGVLRNVHAALLPKKKQI